MTRTLRSIGYAGLMLVLGSVAPASAGVITLTNSTTGNFDGSSGTRSVTVTGAELGYDTGIITDVNISINFAKADGEDFDPPYPGGIPFYNEIHFHLTSPSASLVHLIEAGSWGTGIRSVRRHHYVRRCGSARSELRCSPNGRHVQTHGTRHTRRLQR